MDKEQVLKLIGCGFPACPDVAFDRSPETTADDGVFCNASEHVLSLKDSYSVRMIRRSLRKTALKKCAGKLIDTSAIH